MDKTQHVEALLMWVAQNTAGQNDHVYCVGGAVRNHMMGLPPKDADLVIDTIAAGRTSSDFATLLANILPVRTNLTVNQYGVSILTLAEPWNLSHGQTLPKQLTIEVANARKESYGAASGQGYKPHMVVPCTIQEDVLRRDFTVNTLLWRLSDLANGFGAAPVLDLLGTGIPHLTAGVLACPQDPDKTFTDDPTRMLRAVKFATRYGFTVEAATLESIQRNAAALRGMPWDAVRKILIEDILEADRAHAALGLMQQFGLTSVLAGWLAEEAGFQTALNRSLARLPAALSLRVEPLGWGSGCVSFLPEAARADLLARLNTHTLTTEAVEDLVGVLRKPPVDQPKLFAQLGLQGADRSKVLATARELLVQNPFLAASPADLEARVVQALTK